MQIDIHITPERIIAPPPKAADGTGAVAEFSGIVRGEENGQPIRALEYEAYRPMAETEIRRILTALDAHAFCQSALVIHRVGVVPVGETAIFVRITSRHRGEAFAMLTGFMDRLKQDVPIWKVRAHS